MLGLFLLYFIGKYFYKLSEKYNKNKWLFAIIGIGSYYTGTFLTAFFIGIVAAINNSTFVDDSSKFVTGLICLPFGLLTCWGLYKFLEYKWSKKTTLSNYKLLDDNLID